MWSRFRRTSGRRAAELLTVAALLALGGCSYGFEGGGFPPHIESIYIAPFDNQTAQFDLEQELFTEMLERLPRQLGIRTASESNADAVLRGRITRYDDVAQNYRPGSGERGPEIVAQEVTVVISAELVDVRQNVIRWESGGLTGRGTYLPDSETDREGQRLAIRNLVDLIINGAQSQW